MQNQPLNKQEKAEQSEGLNHHGLVPEHDHHHDAEQGSEKRNCCSLCREGKRGNCKSKAEDADQEIKKPEDVH